VGIPVPHLPSGISFLTPLGPPKPTHQVLNMSVLAKRKAHKIVVAHVYCLTGVNGAARRLVFRRLQRE